MKPNIYDYDKSACSIVENNSLYNRHLLKLRNIYEPPKGVPGLQQQFNQFSKLQLQMIDDRKRLKEQQFIQKKIRFNFLTQQTNKAISHKLSDIFTRKQIFYDHTKNPTMVDDFQNRYRSNKVKVSYEEKKAVYQHISKENARITQRLKAKSSDITFANLERNYKKNLELRNTRLLFKQDPQSKKFILNNSLVFEGGRYRYSGEKYLTISRKNSLTDSLSNQGSRKSLARSVRSTRVPTVENFHVPDDFRNSRNELKTSNSRFNVKVSVASWRVTSGRSKHSETKDQFPPSAKDQRTPRSSSQLIEDNGRLLANIGFNFKTMQDSIRKEMPTDSKKFNSSFNSVVKSTDVEEKYREQLRGKSSRNVGSQRGSDALWLR